MKKPLFLLFILCSVSFVKGQSLTYEYDYDRAGNRVQRIVVRLFNRDFEEKSVSPLTDILGNGMTMSLFPNPTKENIRFELNDNEPIGNYSLSDFNGRILTQGYCKETTLIVDLSDYQKGIYLLELTIKGKQHSYKIIKQ